ncbi:MAG: hypothetical protein HY918_05535 [Candidatus Doudnabacteria bacterium]|nr:hypothetical protein [Candidatus Doudnabacteria bacterium]
MEVIVNLVPNFAVIFQIAFLFITKGGWVLFVIGLIYMLWRMYYTEIRHQYVHNQEWIFLSIKVPRENLVSTMAVDTIFTHMHALHSSKTFAETYMEGHDQLWYSLEIVSLGGKISFVLRIPKNAKNLVEAAFYSHYPQAEINVVNDYLENVHYDPETSTDIDVFGTEWKLEEDDVFPLKTFRDFEHPAAEETIIDPLANLFESLTKIEPHELFAIQIIIQPLGDNEWKPRAERKVKELIGEELPHTVGFLDILLAPFNWFAKFSYKDALLGGGHGHGHEEEKAQKNNWMSLTETEKERVTLVEKKMSKPGYRTKIRFLYIAPKNNFDLTKRGIFIGAYRQMGSAMSNKLKPETNRTWTGLTYKFSKELEAPYMDYVLKIRKRRIFKGFKDRDIHLGMPMFILNTEEVSTLYHFPITTKTTMAPSAIEKTDSKKSQPPVDLPLAGPDSGF